MVQEDRRYLNEVISRQQTCWLLNLFTYKLYNVDLPGYYDESMVTMIFLCMFPINSIVDRLVKNFAMLLVDN